MALRSNAPVEDDGYIPFAMRFRAWWEGVDAADLMTSSDRSAVHGQTLIVDDKPPGLVPATGLDPDRLRLWAALWGEGLVQPGGVEFTESLLLTLGLKAEDRLLDLNAGLGGAARAVARRFECTVAGLEHRKQVAEAGHAMSEAAGMAAVVPIGHYDPMSFDANGVKFDAVYSREFLYQVRDKETLLRKVVRSVREGGHITFTDYALNDFDQSDPDIAAWANAEPIQPQTWTLKRYKQVLDDQDISIQVFADITDTLLELTKTAWSRFTDDLPNQKINKRYADWLLSDGEVWLSRTRAMESGKLRVLRVHAIREGMSMMTDW